MNSNQTLDLVAALQQSKSKKQINSDIRQLEKAVNMLRITGIFAKGDTKKELNAYISQLSKQLSAIKLNAKVDSQKLKNDVDKALRNMSFQDIDILDIDENKLKLKLKKVIADVRADAPDIPIAVTEAKTKESGGILTTLQKIGGLFDIASKAADAFVNSLKTLKTNHTILTEIAKAGGAAKTQLKELGNEAFKTAGKYGLSSTDYLLGVQGMARSGYGNASKELGELSLLAQSATGMTAELANQTILAADKAYKMNGSVSELTRTLDGMNAITTHNAVSMAEISEAMSIVGSTAASLGVGADEASAALGTMMASTQQGGSEAAKALNSILLHTRQISDEQAGINADGLAGYEDACNALNVSLRETKNGVTSLRDPMEVLKELAAEYNKLGEGDSRRADLLSSLGGDVRTDQFDALLGQWDTYETMLAQYAEGNGSMAAEAEKMAGSWEGCMNRLSDTWTYTISNLANSDAIVTLIDSLNSLLSIVNDVTENIGSLATIELAGFGFGLKEFIKNLDHREVLKIA